MIFITAKQTTKLTKLPKQSSHPDNQSSGVPAGKIFGVESLGEIVGTKQKVVLAYGAGTWWVHIPHWRIPQQKHEEKYIKNNEKFKRYNYPNTKEGNLKRIIECCKDFNCTKAQAAYIIATTRWETGNTFMPVKEAFYISRSEAAAEAWRKRNLRYYPYYGRGFVQITWEVNYKKYEDLLGLPLVSKPNMVMDPDVAVFILVHGSMNGVFTGKALPEFVAIRKRDYYRARTVINGYDKAKEIAAIAEAWYNGQTLADY